ncbi:MAG: hypothetical protein MI725_11045 [Pirellulales bacterium]|nr:hypothetical protein [Pirellulales bacterium]
MSDLTDYAWLTGGEAAPWLDEFSDCSEPLHRQLQRLRKVLSAAQARLVVEQVELRRRAETKFGPLAARMFFTDVALQQATDWWTARYKAARIGTGVAVQDYCCGIGGNLLAWAQRGPVTGWDYSPQVACFAEANLHAVGLDATAKVCVGNVEEQIPPKGEVWHLDPDRRQAGRRSTKLAWHSPGPQAIERFRQASPNGVLKLAPAAEIPAAWKEDVEVEWISWDRQCRQAVVWFGQLARETGKRRATVVAKTADPWAAPVIHSFFGESNCRAHVTNAISNYIYDVDVAVRAAGLTGALAVSHNLAAVGTEAEYLTGNHRITEPLLSPFEVLDQMPLRVGPLGKHLRKLGVGRLEIKKRTLQIDPEQLRRQLKLRGDESRTLLLTRLGNREIAILAKRCSHGVTDGVSTS